MINLRDIANGWKNVVIPDEQIEVISRERLAICSECPSKTKMLGLDCCNVCDCPLMAKTRSIDSKCPLGKW